MPFLGSLSESANRLSVKRHGTEDPHLPPEKKLHRHQKMEQKIQTDNFLLQLEMR